MSTFSLTRGSEAALGMLASQAGSETLLLTQPARELRAELSIEPFTSDSGDQLLAVLLMREQRHSMTLQRNDGANVQHLADWVEAAANGTLDTAEAIPQRASPAPLLPCSKCNGAAIGYDYSPSGSAFIHGVRCRHRTCQAVEGAETEAEAHDAWNAIQLKQLVEPSDLAAATAAFSAAAHELNAHNGQQPIRMPPRADVTQGDGFDSQLAEAYNSALDEVARLNANPIAQTVPQHPDDEAVDRFAVAMKAKLAASREKGRHGWQNATAPHLSALLYDHLYKADPLDVGNLAMMLHQNGQAIELPQEARGRKQTAPQPDQSMLVEMIDAAMLEMRNVAPPLRRSECERLIRAAVATSPKA